MKKFIFSLVIMMMTVFSVNAQVATENAKLFDNTYVTVEAGVATPLAFDAIFPVNPIVGVAVGKWFTPVWGAEIEGTAWFGSHVYGGTDARVNMNANGNFNAVHGTYVGGNGLVNLSNLFAGYNGAPRTFEVGAVAGIGWVHGYRPNIKDNYNNDLGAKTGLTFNFNLGATKAHTISIRPAVLWDLSEPGNAKGGLAFNKLGAQLNLGVAYTYHFKTSNGTRHFKTYDVGAMLAEIDYLNSELAKKPTTVTDTVVKIIEVNKPTINTEQHATGFGINETVYFAYDSSELDARAKETLDNLGQNGVYCIDAYASNEGSADYNKALSQRRADAVKAYLEARGAKVESAIGYGVVFGPTTGRVAVVTLK